jgi:hypothetical protein
MGARLLRYFISETDIAVAESPKTHWQLVDRGYTQVDYVTYRKAWQYKDYLAISNADKELEEQKDFSIRDVNNVRG